MKTIKLFSMVILTVMLLSVCVPNAFAAGVVLSEPFSYTAGYLLNTTGASGNWTGGWKADNKLTTALDSTYTVATAGQVFRNSSLNMYRGTSSITLNGEYDYFFKWDESLNNTTSKSASIGAVVTLIYNIASPNGNTKFGIKALSDTSVGQFIPYVSLQGGDNNNGNSNVILNNNTLYTIVSRLSSRGTTTKAVTGKMMAYQAGTTQPGSWQTQSYSATLMNGWTFGAVGMNGSTYDAAGAVTFKGLTIEKYTKAEIDAVDTAVNTALASKLPADIQAAQSQITTLTDGIAKDTFNAQINAITYQADVDAAKANLNITYASGDSASSVIQNLTLPTSGTNGTAVAWSSSNTSIVANDGTVTRPKYGSGDQALTLTATISKAGLSDTKTFNVTVKRYFADESFNYPDNTLLSATTVDYANGFSSKWMADKNLTTELASHVSSIPAVDYKAIGGKAVTTNYGWAMYRKLQKPINMGTNTDYYIRYNQAMSKTTSTSSSDTSRLYLNDTGSSTQDYYGFAMHGSAAPYMAYPGLQLYTTGGRINSSTDSNLDNNTKAIRNVMYTFIIKLEARTGTGTVDNAYMKVFETGTQEPAEWELQPTAQNFSTVYNVIGFSGATYAATQGGTYSSIRLEEYDPAATDYTNANTAVNTAEASNSPANIDAAQTAVNLLTDGLAKNHFQARINKLKKTVYVGIHNFTKTVGATVDTLACLVNLKNMDTVNPNNATVIMVRYEGTKMAGVTLTPSANAPIAAGANITRTISMDIPKDTTNQTISVYVWNDTTVMKPHVNKYTYPLYIIQ